MQLSGGRGETTETMLGESALTPQLVVQMPMEIPILTCAIVACTTNFCQQLSVDTWLTPHRADAHEDPYPNGRNCCMYNKCPPTTVR